MTVLFRRLQMGPEPNPTRTSPHLKYGLSQGMLYTKQGRHKRGTFPTFTSLHDDLKSNIWNDQVALKVNVVLRAT